MEKELKTKNLSKAWVETAYKYEDKERNIKLIDIPEVQMSTNKLEKQAQLKKISCVMASF